MELAINSGLILYMYSFVLDLLDEFKDYSSPRALSSYFTIAPVWLHLVLLYIIVT